MRARVRARRAIADRLTPERTRDATLFERLTVARLSWSEPVRLNGWLELALLAPCARRGCALMLLN